MSHSSHNNISSSGVEPYAGGYTKASLEAEGYVAETYPRYWLNVTKRRQETLKQLKVNEPAKQPPVERTFIHDENDTRGYEALQLAAARERLAQGALNNAGVVMIPVEVNDYRNGTT